MAAGVALDGSAVVMIMLTGIPIFAAVRRLMTIAMMTIFLCASTELHQLLKLPVLIHHYLEHRQKDHSISFFAFLKEHYVYEHAMAAQDHHERLPFKSHDCAGMHMTIADPDLPSFLLPGGETGFAGPLTLYKEPWHASTVLASIWQPPKSC